MSKLELLKGKLEQAQKDLAECEKAIDKATAAYERQQDVVDSLTGTIELAIEIAEEVRTEKDATFRESLATLYTSGRTDADIATAFAEANVSPPAELQLPSLEEKEADDDKESNEAA